MVTAVIFIETYDLDFRFMFTHSTLVLNLLERYSLTFFGSMFLFQRVVNAEILPCTPSNCVLWLLPIICVFLFAFFRPFLIPLWSASLHWPSLAPSQWCHRRCRRLCFLVASWFPRCDQWRHYCDHRRQQRPLKPYCPHAHDGQVLPHCSDALRQVERSGCSWLILESG